MIEIDEETYESAKAAGEMTCESCGRKWFRHPSNFCLTCRVIFEETINAKPGGKD
jgi:hypothetical protein